MKSIVPMCVCLLSCSSAPSDESCSAVAPGALEVTEAMVVPGGSGGEWIEVRNVSRSPVDATGLAVFARNSDGSENRSQLITFGQIKPGGLAVFGEERRDGQPSWMDATYQGALARVAASGGAIGIRCGKTVVSELAWVAPAKRARTRMLASTQDNDGGAPTVCDAPTTLIYAPPNAGTPNAPNPNCPVEVEEGRCRSPLGIRKLVSPQPGDLLVNEFMADPSHTTDAQGEYVELLVRRTVDVNSIQIHTGNRRAALESESCLRFDAGTYLLMGRSADGGLGAVDFVGPLSLGNSSGTIEVLGPDGGVLDQVEYGKSSAGRSQQRTAAGKWCTTPTSASARLPSGDFGTPGRHNLNCP